MFDTVTGLPVHPLVVHAAVVLLPLSALALIAMVFVPRLRRAYALPTVVGLGIGFVSAFIAKESGEKLAGRIGSPGEHAEYGDWLMPVSFGLFVLAAVWWFLQRRGETTATRALGLGSSLVAIATIALTVLAGHTGAKAAWAGRLEPAPVVTPSAGAAKSYSLATVAKHGTQADCWAVVDGNVYNLTSWISKHPGGSDKIIAMCGKDGSAAFNGQHGGSSDVKKRLATFKIGTLAS